MKEIFYLTMPLNAFLIVIWRQTYGKGPLMAREESHCHYYMGYSFQLATRGLLYAPLHRQDRTAFVTPVVKHWLE